MLTSVVKASDFLLLHGNGADERPDTQGSGVTCTVSRFFRGKPANQRPK
jgi:hypothetical protein